MVPLVGRKETPDDLVVRKFVLEFLEAFRRFLAEFTGA